MKFDLELSHVNFVKAPIDLCFKIFTEERPGWGKNLAKFARLEPGHPTPGGAGAVHALWRPGTDVNGPPQVVDLCNQYFPPYLYGLKNIGFLPENVLDQTQQVFLFRAVDGGTEITTHVVSAFTEDARANGAAAQMAQLAGKYSNMVISDAAQIIEERAKALQK